MNEKCAIWGILWASAIREESQATTVKIASAIPPQPWHLVNIQKDKQGFWMNMR